MSPETLVLLILLCASVVLLALAFTLWEDEGRFFGAFVGGFLAIIAFAWMISLVSAARDAEFYRRSYGTSYSASDFFWNGNDIKDVVIGKKSRIILQDSSRLR